MNQEERLLHIFTYLKEHGAMSIHTICKQLNVSRDTARRDILKLIDHGVASRSYGGISLPVLRNTIKEYRERLKERSDEKERIAQEAMTWINEDGYYFIDVSTTIRYLVEKIHQRIRVFTHSLDNIELLAEKENVEVYSLGGRLDKKNRYFYQAGAAGYLDHIRFDTAFLGACTIKEDGVYYPDEQDAIIKQAAITKSDRVILLTEYEKFDAAASYSGANWRGASWDQIHMIITDQQLSPKFAKMMTEHRVQLIVV